MSRILLAGLALIAVALSSRTAEARYRPLQLDDLLGRSTLVLVGEITELREHDYTLKISETLAGQHPATTIVIQRFRDWTCASRWGPYAVGQKLLVCTRKVVDEKSGAVTWRIRSGGGEGEMPIVGDQVHFRGPGAGQAPLETCRVHGRDVQFRRFDLATIRERVSKLRRKSVAPQGQ